MSRRPLQAHLAASGGSLVMSRRGSAALRADGSRRIAPARRADLSSDRFDPPHGRLLRGVGTVSLFHRIRLAARGRRRRAAAGIAGGLVAVRPRRGRRPTALPIWPKSCCLRWSTSRPPRPSSRSAQARAIERADVPQFPPGSPFEEFFKDFFEQEPARRPPAGPAAQGDLARLGLYHRCRRLRRHQQPRDRRRRRDHRDPARRHPPEGRGRRPRHQDRHRRAEGQDRQAAGCRDLGRQRRSRGSATGCWRSATRSGSAAASRPASCRPGSATSIPAPTTISCRPTPRSTAAIPAGRCSTWKARSSASTRRSIRRSGGSIGIGFAIPSNLAKAVVAQLSASPTTTVHRGWLGVRIQAVTDEIAESLGLDKPKGALVASVSDNGPAQAGRDSGRRRRS